MMNPNRRPAFKKPERTPDEKVRDAVEFARALGLSGSRLRQVGRTLEFYGRALAEEEEMLALYMAAIEQGGAL